MKKTLNLALITAMFATFAIADDGNQGSGGRSCNPETDPLCHPAANPAGNNGEGTGYDVNFGGIIIRIVTDAIEIIG